MSLLVSYYRSQITPKFGNFKQLTFIISQFLWVIELYHSFFISLNLRAVELSGSGSSSLSKISAHAVVIWRLDRLENPLSTSFSDYWQEAAPRGPLHGAAHDMAADFPQSEWSKKEDKR